MKILLSKNTGALTVLVVMVVVFGFWRRSRDDGGGANIGGGGHTQVGASWRQTWWFWG
jgi:hypothetical protein